MASYKVVEYLASGKPTVTTATGNSLLPEGQSKRFCGKKDDPESLP